MRQYREQRDSAANWLSRKPPLVISRSVFVWIRRIILASRTYVEVHCAGRGKETAGTRQQPLLAQFACRPLGNTAMPTEELNTLY